MEDDQFYLKVFLYLCILYYVLHLQNLLGKKVQVSAHVRVWLNGQPCEVL
jgi:hypothetical protein